MPGRHSECIESNHDFQNIATKYPWALKGQTHQAIIVCDQSATEEIDYICLLGPRLNML